MSRISLPIQPTVRSFGNNILCANDTDKAAWTATGFTYNTGSLSFYFYNSIATTLADIAAGQTIFSSTATDGGWISLSFNSTAHSFALSFWKPAYAYSADTVTASNYAYGSIRGGQWNHMIVTWNGTTGNPTNAKFYINGVYKAIASETNMTITGCGAGATLFDNAIFSEATWKGGLDDFAIYNRAINETEVFRIFTEGYYPTNGLLSLHKFDEASGNALDSSGNGRTGTITGATREVHTL